MANPTTTTTTTKRHRTLSNHHHQSLLPGLPDHISHLILSLIPPTTLCSVCRAWRRFVYSPLFPPFLSLYTLSLPTTTTVTTAATTTSAAVDGVDGQIPILSSYDPISSKWNIINSPPLPHFHHHHPSFISRTLPIQSLTVAGKLILLAATFVHHNNIPFPAFPHPLIFNPMTNTWSSGPPLPTPRRWCAAGALQDTVVVASGLGYQYTETVARSVEKWVVRKNVSYDEKPRDFNGNIKKIQSMKVLELKNNDENLKKIQSLKFLEQKHHHGNMEKIQSMNFLENKNDGNLKKIESLNFLEHKNDGSFKKFEYSLLFSKGKNECVNDKRRYSNGNLKKRQSLKYLEQKNDEDLEKIHSLRMKQKNDGNLLKKIQSLKFAKQKSESLDGKGRDSIEYLKKLNLEQKSKTESFDEKWETMQSLKNSKLCREGIEAVGWRGNLCMVNVKGDYTKEGFIYNLDSDKWSEMPVGMLGGWKGPVAAMEEETMYVVDESKGVLRRYDEDVDNWVEVMVDERLKGAEYIAAGGGRVCVVCRKNVDILVVDVVAVPPRLWVVERCPGYEILAIHILPRMCLPEEF